MITDKVASSGAIETVASKVTYTAAGATVVFGLTANEAAAIGGLIVALLSMIASASISFYFKNQHLKLAIERDRYDREMMSVDRRKKNIPVEFERRSTEPTDDE